MKDLDQKLASYLDGELEEREADHLAGQLEQNPEALRRLAELSNVDRMLETTQAPFDSRAFTRRVMNSLGAPKSGQTAPAEPRARPPLGVLAAAGLAAACLFWLLQHDLVRPSTPRQKHTATQQAASGVQLQGKFEVTRFPEGPWTTLDGAPEAGMFIRATHGTGQIRFTDGSQMSLSSGGMLRLKDDPSHVELHAGRLRFINQGQVTAQISLAAGTVDVPAGQSVEVTLEVTDGTILQPRGLQFTMAGPAEAGHTSFLQLMAAPASVVAPVMVLPATVATPHWLYRSRALLRQGQHGKWSVQRIQTTRVGG